MLDLLKCYFTNIVIYQINNSLSRLNIIIINFQNLLKSVKISPLWQKKEEKENTLKGLTLETMNQLVL